jgi:hypothetical protein
MTRLRVAALQYFIRPLQTFDQFREQVVGSSKQPPTTAPRGNKSICIGCSMDSEVATHPASDAAACVIHGHSRRSRSRAFRHT